MAAIGSAHLAIGRAVGSDSTEYSSRRLWLQGLISILVRVLDGLILLSAATVAYWIYFDFPVDQMYAMLAAFALLLQLYIFHFLKLYDVRQLANIDYQVGHVCLAASLFFVTLAATLYITKLSIIYSRAWMALWFMLTIGGSVVARLVISRIARAIINQGHFARRIAVVGSGLAAERLVGHLHKVPPTRIQLAGLFDDHGARTGDVRVQGTIDDLCQSDCNRNIDAIVLAMPDVSEERLSEILGKLSPLPVDIRLCRDSLEHCLPQSSYEFCEGVPLLRLYDKPVSGGGLLAKTIEDKLLAGLLLLLSGGLMLAIAGLIKIDSRGPALFRQKRYGLNNQLIEVLKFRTMLDEARDEDAEQLTTRNDPRVTRIGTFLRRTSLDELPQLLNVMYGDMSLVGPRPHAVAAKAAGILYKDAVSEYAARHRVKPGITGWAQVNGWRGETDTVEKIQQRVKHDLFYIDNWSILFDLKILLMTFYNVVLDRDNAY